MNIVLVSLDRISVYISHKMPMNNMRYLFGPDSAKQHKDNFQLKRAH